MTDTEARTSDVHGHQRERDERMNETYDESIDRQCAWADYRKDCGALGLREMAAAHKTFMAGWQAALSRSAPSTPQSPTPTATGT